MRFPSLGTQNLIITAEEEEDVDKNPETLSLDIAPGDYAISESRASGQVTLLEDDFTISTSFLDNQATEGETDVATIEIDLESLGGHARLDIQIEISPPPVLTDHDRDPNTPAIPDYTVSLIDGTVLTPDTGDGVPDGRARFIVPFTMEGSQTLSITAGEDLDHEDETLEIRRGIGPFMAEGGADFISANGITIEDNDALVSLTSSDTDAEEGDPSETATLSLILQGDSFTTFPVAVLVDISGLSAAYSVSNSGETPLAPETASEGVDRFTVTFDRAEEKTLIIEALEDENIEDETLTVSLSPAPGYAISQAQSEVEVSLRDNDARVSLALNGEGRAYEEDSSAPIQVDISLNALSSTSVDVLVKIAPAPDMDDYRVSEGGSALSPQTVPGGLQYTLRFSSIGTKTLSIEALDDTDTTDETLSIGIETNEGYAVSVSMREVQVTLIDNDFIASLTGTDLEAIEGETGETASITVGLSPTPTASREIQMTISPSEAMSDYTLTAGETVLEPKVSGGLVFYSVSVMTNVEVLLRAIHDNDTNSETLTVRLSEGSGYRISGSDISITLVDDDIDISDRSPFLRDILKRATGAETLEAVSRKALGGLDTLKIQNVITLVPGDFEGLTNLTSLRIDNNRMLTELGADVFRGLDSLTGLTIDNNRMLTELGADVFRGLSSLTRLVIGNNAMLTELGADVFQELDSLTTLEIRRNARLTNVDVNAFRGLSTLITLDMRSQPALVVLPPGVFDPVLGSLTRLLLDDEHKSTVNLEGQASVTAGSPAVFTVTAGRLLADINVTYTVGAPINKSDTLAISAGEDARGEISIDVPVDATGAFTFTIEVTLQETDNSFIRANLLFDTDPLMVNIIMP